MRIEDIDVPRVAPGASSAIITTLAACGFEWDGDIVYQSARQTFYRDAIDHLQTLGVLYRCCCKRREIADSALMGPIGPIYPGTCRNLVAEDKRNCALRLRTEDAVIEFEDRVQGRISQNLAQESGDFILRRSDGIFAYQLAVVIDDTQAQVTDIVRGADLLASTPCQIYLQHLLGFQTPRYSHVPVALNSAGRKLSKQTLAATIDPAKPVPALVDALLFLNQHAPEDLGRSDLDTFWQWALATWNPGRIPRVGQLQARFAEANA